MVTIALDAMGGDFGHAVVVPAALKALSLADDLNIQLVGPKSILSKALNKAAINLDCKRVVVKNATQIVEMDESPSSALRSKKDASMRVMLDAIRSGEAHACVSSGNTGALMAMARFVLRMIDGIDRPAIVSALPGLQGFTYVLDLGANVDCTPEQLLQFALMGSVLSEIVTNLKAPRIALLSNGSEAVKGNQLVKRAHAYLSAHRDLNFIGYVEGDDIYCGSADVIVCDGFVGNVALKASEGVSMFIRHHLKAAFSKNLFALFAAFCAKPALKYLSKTLDRRRYNGAFFLGLQGIVVKSHGNADIDAFVNAIFLAKHTAAMNLTHLLHTRIQALDLK